VCVRRSLGFCLGNTMPNLALVCIGCVLVGLVDIEGSLSVMFDATGHGLEVSE
jgi:hypothetical protein